MSEADSRATSVLLPSSQVAVYSTDQQTLEAVTEISKDWRFARVDVTPVQGGIETAIAAYKEYASPDLLIIQTDTIGDELTDNLESLAGHCDENTAAILIGPVNDVNLYRKLVEMGVSDYLVGPVEAQALSEVMAKALIERLGVSESRLIALVGAKGGVGTSVLSQAMAWGSADLLGQRTVLFDGSGGWSIHSVGMGFEPSTTLAAAARSADAGDEDGLSRMILNIDGNLNVLGSGGDVMLEPAVTADHMEKLVGTLMTKYPVVIADLSCTPPDIQKAVLLRASHIGVVTTPMLPALRLSRSLIQEIKDLRGDASENIELIVNMAGLEKKQEVSSRDIEQAMGMKPSALIAFDGAVFMKSESEGKKIIDTEQGRSIVQASLLPILKTIISVRGDAGESSQKGSGFVNSLLSRTLKRNKG